MKRCLFLFLLGWCLAFQGRVRAWPQQEDPLLTGNVAVSISPADLYLRELTLPPGLSLWRTLKDLEALNPAQLRTLVHQVWMASRRHAFLNTAGLLVDAWADRDLSGITTDMLTIIRWEDEDPAIGDHDIDLETEAAFHWCRLAELDWKQALGLLSKVNDAESGKQFWRALSTYLTVPPDRLPAFAAAIAPRPRDVDKVMERLVWSCVKAHGAASTERAVGKIKDKRLRDGARAALRNIPAAEDKRPVPSSVVPAFENPVLQKLLALDSRVEARLRFPFPLFRAVLKLPPAEALELARQLPRDPQPPGSWLAWILFMRATDGDPAAALPVATGLSTGELNAACPLTTLYALRSGIDLNAALGEMRAMSSIEDQRDALAGYLTGPEAREIIVQQLGSPLMAFAKQVELPSNRWRAALCAAAAAGSGEAALNVAASMEENAKLQRSGLQTAVIHAWGLTDMPALCRYAASLADAEQIEMMNRSFGSLVPWLSAGIQLDSAKPLPPKLTAFAPGMHWLFLAGEAREQAFRFLEQHAKDPDYRDAIGKFTEAAVRYEPERAVALHRLAGFTGDSDLVGRLVRFHGDEPKVLAAALSTDKQWEFAGREMAQIYPDKTLSLLKNTPGASAWRGAALFFLESDPKKAALLSKYLTEDERSRLNNALK